MTDAFQYDVFLSYSAKDKPVVRAVAEQLRKDGLKVWFDEWVVKAGGNIPAKTEEGLELSRVLVLCMSANAFGSDWAQLEAGTCGRRNLRFRDPLNNERRFIPLRLDNAPTPLGAIPLHQPTNVRGPIMPDDFQCDVFLARREQCLIQDNPENNSCLNRVTVQSLSKL